MDQSFISPSNNSDSNNAIITQPIMEGIILKTSLDTEADIAALTQQLLTIVNRCVPTAVVAYEHNAKKSNADALNLFISQSRELANDIRSQHQKKVQVNKILKECLTPTLQKIYDQMINLPEQIKALSAVEYETAVHEFMSLVAKQIAEKLNEIL